MPLKIIIESEIGKGTTFKITLPTYTNQVKESINQNDTMDKFNMIKDRLAIK